MDVTAPKTSGLKLFTFGTKKKFILLLCTLILWAGAYMAYSIPGFDYSFVASFNSLRADPLFANFWYFYTEYMLYVVIFPLLAVYLASFKIERLKSYRLALFLSIIVLAVGTPLVDPILKDFFARPRPMVAHLDLNTIYYASGFAFPSGHAFQSFAATLPLVICFLTSDETFKRNWKKTTLAFILLLYATALAFSRIFVGVHYLSDVLFGIGLAILLTVIFASLLQWLLNNDKLNLQNEKWYAIPFFIIYWAYIILT